MTTKEIKKDIEEPKAAINMMSEELTNISNGQRTIMNLVGEIKDLKKKNEDQEKKIDFLENRVSDMEQYSRMNNVIITGLVIKPRSYAQALNGPRQQDTGTTDHDETTEAQVATFLYNKNISIDTNNIEACHTLTTKNKTDKPVIIVRFVNRKHNIELLKQAKNLRGSNVYINEHLTQKNAEIARKARFLKKQEKVQSTWTANCKVYIKTNGPSDRAKVLCIRDIAQLNKFDSP